MVRRSSESVSVRRNASLILNLLQRIRQNNFKIRMAISNCSPSCAYRSSFRAYMIKYANIGPFKCYASSRESVGPFWTKRTKCLILTVVGGANAPHIGRLSSRHWEIWQHGNGLLPAADQAQIRLPGLGGAAGGMEPAGGIRHAAPPLARRLAKQGARVCISVLHLHEPNPPGPGRRCCWSTDSSNDGGRASGRC